MNDLLITINDEPVNELHSDGKNPNKMSNKQFEALKSNIQRYGFLVPIITNNDLLIADGEHRWEAAKELGMTKVPVVRLNVNEVDRRLLRQVMNKLRGEHDYDLDMEEYRFLFEQQAGEDLKTLLAMKDKEFQVVKDYLRSIPQEQNIDEIPENTSINVQKGEIWQLGEHRLLCGDSTNIDDIKKLMNGTTARMVHTDPPYNVDYGANKHHPSWKIRAIENDKLNPDQWETFCHQFINNLQEACPEGDYYIWGASGPEGMKQRLWATELGLHWSATIIWVKDSLVLSPANYQRQYEPCFYGWNKKSSYNGDRKNTEVWHYDRPKTSKLHPTMKPISVCSEAIKNSSLEGDIVLDIFGGSGSTLIAAETTNRKCYMIELDQQYCNVIITRWEQLTGKKATRQ